MNTAELDAAIRQAETDLAFALAQGDGYAEDAAAERIAELTRSGCSCGGIDAVPHAISGNKPSSPAKETT